ncbi:DUF5606 domain-containing protein [Chryseolinea sp. T2]|uniref:DUF5606 family protein n=1 Tax=Chryseolinea sp. T2 TaxID=3129255 RepID=UPI003078776C
MTLSEIATVSGKGGLFRIVSPTKSGVILESLDEQKTKLVATTSHRLSLLHEISIYTTTKEGTVPLEAILRKIHSEYGADTGVDANADPSELKAFIKSVLPEYDETRVYVSDIKKLVRWYAVLLKYVPAIFEEKKEEAVKSTEAEPEVAIAEEEKEVKAEKKPKAEKKEGTKTSKKQSEK